MTTRVLTTLALAALGLFALTAWLIYGITPPVRLDAVAVNDVAQTAAKSWDALSGGDTSALQALSYGFDFAVVTGGGQALYATGQGVNTSLHAAVANRDTVVDVLRGGELVGKVIVHNKTLELWRQRQNYLVMVAGALLLLMLVGAGGYGYYLFNNIVTPFKKLEQFATRVAAGNLDIPLEMDRGRLFGAFTESFDLMREQLSRARENERRANQGKKELTAQLSHDIKTPVASIKAVAELMMVRAEGVREKQQLETICAKADQINLLISNMFQATLEELQELKVAPVEVPSSVLPELIRIADYDSRVSMGDFPQCLVLADRSRLQQVFDNIISNSYKYAGTAIKVEAHLEDDFLVVELRDFGQGVAEKELPLVFSKFYRGKNAEGLSGTGLGLYISRYLMNRMGGSISCESKNTGFAVTLRLALAGLRGH